MAPPAPAVSTLEHLRPYRVLLVLIAGGNAAFALARALDGAAAHDPVGLRAAVSGLALVVALTMPHVRVLRRHARALLYGVAYVLISASTLLCVWNEFAPSYAVGYLALVATLGLGGAVTSTRTGAMTGVLAASVVLPLAGLAATDAPDIGRAAFVLSLLTTAVVAVVVAHERTRARARFVAEQALYRSVFERASDALYVADGATRRVLDANPAYLRLSGYSLAELRVLRIDDLIDAGDGERSVADNFAATRQAGTFEIGLRRLKTRDGRAADIDVSATWIESDSDPAGGLVSVVARDATQRLATERALRDAVTEADAARTRAEELLRLKTSFLSNMSHEIRTPLTGILGYAELLADETTGDAADMVAVIARSAARLHRTLNSVLDLARLESDGQPACAVPVDLVAEVEASFETLRPLAEACGLTLRCDAPGDDAEPVWASAEPGAVARILDNLVGNALKFTDVGGVTVRVAQTGDRAVLAVADTGPGIPEAFRPALFAEFEQASTGHARTHEGSGLGLAITKRLVEGLGGTIGVESEVGHGATFTVTLPAGLPAAERAAVAEAA